MKVRRKKSRRNLLDRLYLWILQRAPFTKVDIDGVRVVDTRKRNDSFFDTIKEALGLLREYDTRRHRRVTRHIHWIINDICPSGWMSYNDSKRICSVEFHELEGYTHDEMIAVYASGLVHEATHGVVFAFGIPYNKRTRVRIEKLCIVEQNRFAAALSAQDAVRYPLERVRTNRNEHDWERVWNLGRWSRAKRFISKIRNE